MPWTVLSHEACCGYDGQPILAGAPVWQHTTAPRILRCAVHAPEPVDIAAIDQARHALDAHRSAVAQLSADQPIFVQPSRRRLFDSRAAAAGEKRS